MASTIPRDRAAPPGPPAVRGGKVPPLNEARAGAGQVEGALPGQARRPRGPPADEGAARSTTAGCAAAPQPRHGVGIEPADRDIIEERERLRATAHDIVGA